MGIPNMHTTIDYAKLIELQAKAVEEKINDTLRGKVRQKSMQPRKRGATVRK
jgi:hypothetical protein